MAMLKTIGQGHSGAKKGIPVPGQAGHVGSCKNIDEYLWYGPAAERHGASQSKQPGPEQGPDTNTIEAYLEHGHGVVHRPLAFAQTPELSQPTDTPGHGWSREMDETRQRLGKDKGRTYYHYVISFAPEDHAGAELACAVGLEWVETCFPGAQAVVSVHADNASHLMHAHVIINSVIPATGLKIQISDRKTVEIADALQDICAAHGLTPMEKLSERRRREREAGRSWNTGQQSYRTTAERELVESGRRSWVAETRRAIDLAVESSHSLSEFEEHLRRMGWAVNHPRRGGLTFVHPSSTGHDKRVRGARLGTDYTLEGILARMGAPFGGLLEDGSPATAALVAGELRDVPKVYRRERLRRASESGVKLPSYRGPMGVEEFVARRHTMGRAQATRDVQVAVDAVGTMRKYGLASTGDVLSALSAESERLRTLEARAAVVRRESDTTEELARAITERDALAGELERLDAVRHWSARQRARRREAADRMADLQALIGRDLSGAASWLDSHGLTGATDASKAAAIAARLGEEAASVARQSDECAARLARLQEAADVLGPAYPVRRPTGRPKPPRLQPPPVAKEASSEEALSTHKQPAMSNRRAEACRDVLRQIEREAARHDHGRAQGMAAQPKPIAGSLQSPHSTARESRPRR